MKYGKATVGLFSLHCACGRALKSIDILERTVTGRETVRHYCHHCGCISWWYRTFGQDDKVMLVDREEKPAGAEKWPPRGWMYRHCPPRKVR